MVPGTGRTVEPSHPHRGTRARRRLKSSQVRASKYFAPAPPSGPPIASHCGRVWVYVQGCMACTERTALGGFLPSKGRARNGRTRRLADVADSGLGRLNWGGERPSAKCRYRVWERAYKGCGGDSDFVQGRHWGLFGVDYRPATLERRAEYAKFRSCRRSRHRRR